jgi:hypothetical protein
MDKLGTLVLSVSVVALLIMASSTAGAFIGAGINLDKQFGNTINFNLGGDIPIGNTAFGVAGLNIGVTYGVNYDLSALAGYPYDYGGVGAVTNGALGYNLGITVNTVQGGGVNGADWGVPLDEQGITTTQMSKEISEEAQLSNTQVALP